MKKLTAVFAVITLLLALTGGQVFAADSAKVSVTVANGSLVLAGAEIEVTDADGDGALTVNDALILAHDTAFEGGSAAGYSYYAGDFGLAISKLWGVENGGSYGYYVNNASAMSLADPIAEGDSINAFVYSDTAAFSDVYCYFDVNSVRTATQDPVSLTLYAAAFDENWNPVVKPVAGAVITLNGERSAFVTDENGKVTITLNAPGSYTISAVSDSATIVPPCCLLTTIAAPALGASDALLAAAALALCSALAAVRLKRSKKSL